MLYEVAMSVDPNSFPQKLDNTFYSQGLSFGPA